MKENLLKLSIIMSIYNAENYLENSLKSILKQVDASDEVILINDGSIDRSFEICKIYKEMYYQKNIMIINKKNEGVSVARNYGLKISSGDYILWIDADDWVSNEYINEIKKCIIETNADIILFDYYEVKKEKQKKISYKDRACYINKNDIMKDIAQDKFASTLWRLAIKRKIYNKIEFPNVKTMEDYAIYHELFYYADSCMYIYKPIYFYRVLENSLSHRKDQDIIDRYKVIKKREQFFKKNYSFFKEIYYKLPILINIGAFLENNLISDKEKRDIRILILKNIKFLLSRKYLSLSKKIQMIVYLISPILLRIIRKNY